MAALNVFVQVGRVADATFLATDVLPTLWQFSLGPLLDLNQFQTFMALIKSLSARIEQEQIQKLQELTSSAGETSYASRQAGHTNGFSQATNEQGDFESLVSGRKTSVETPKTAVDQWTPQTTIRPSTSQNSSQRQRTNEPKFSWSSTPISPVTSSQPSAQRLQLAISRAVTPDVQLRSASANPISSFAQPMQPQRPGMNAMAPLQPQSSIMNNIGILQPQPPGMKSSMGGMNNMQPKIPSTTVDWSAATAPKTNWGSMSSNTAFTQNIGAPQGNNSYSSFKIAPPVSQSSTTMQPGTGTSLAENQKAKQGLDKYESLL